jgi:alkanesulfonate monooxygenase SsuD/methylene tetrahydromethanopterin reductase-like flavin-dependent oxidoreductase (luciferase family)
VAAAFSAVTSRIRISVAALLLNLYDPVRVAEDIAVLDHLSGGRVSWTIGLGYRPEEYELLGRSWESRGADIEAAILRLQEVWADDRTFPKPFSTPHPFLLYGGGSLAAARRAGRLGLHFQPQHGDPALVDAYVEACQEAGRPPGFALSPPTGPGIVFCSADPDAFWQRYGSYLLADARGYAAWRQPGQQSFVADAAETVEQLRAGDTYLVATPDELVERCRSGEVSLVGAHPLCGGMPPEPSWESLELLASVVRPQLMG